MLDSVKAHDVIPDFEAVDDEGNAVTLTGLLADGPVVLFFYPKALTPGCTQEACHFRDLQGEFAELGARPVGISADPVDRQVQFRQDNGFPFPLLSDPDKQVAGLFGVKRWGPLPNKRTTFVIGTDRRILDIIQSETKMEAHADEALSALRAHL